MTVAFGGTHMHVVLDNLGRVRELRRTSTDQLSFVDPNSAAAFGDVRLTLGTSAGDQRVHTGEMDIDVRPLGAGVAVTATHPDHDLVIHQRWEPVRGHLEWSVEITSPGTIHDLAVAVPFNTHYSPDAVTTYRRRVVRHDDADGTVIYAVRADGEGHCLLLQPADPHTCPAGVTADLDHQTSGWEGQAWLRVNPVHSDQHSFHWRFDWVETHTGVPDAVYATGGIDVTVSPGLVIPADLTAQVAVRSRSGACSIRAIDPGNVRVREVRRNREYQIFEIQFDRVGEHRLVVCDEFGRHRAVDFFSTRPLAGLIESRQAFLIDHQQYRGHRWYDGLFSNWDMSLGRMTTPDDPLGLEDYMVGGSDDPTICKAPTLAELSLVHPRADAIDAMDYYIDRFVIGGLQRVGEQPYDFGIYGSPNWHVNRRDPRPIRGNGGHGREHLWRTFDYTHLIQLYIVLHLLATRNPGLPFRRSAAEYLELAFRTSRAFFEVPYSIFMTGWDHQGYCDWAFKQGNFHETRILDVIRALDDAGRSADADLLRTFWEAKVRYMIFDHPYPFGSEMWFDSTAFESTYAVGRYAADTPVPADPEGWTDLNARGPGQGMIRQHPSVTQERAHDFLLRQARANMAARGMFEPTWFRLGSDIRQHGTTSYTLSYMTGLGGGALLDWGIAESHGNEAVAAIRAGYGAYLATFALIHTGADYPWWPEAENAGALAWAFAPQPGRAWIGRDIERGPWPLDGENDSGLAGALRAARCVVFEDPVFGRTVLGGTITDSDDAILVHPRDGARRQVDVLLAGAVQRVISDEHPIRIVRIANDGTVLEVIHDT